MWCHWLPWSLRPLTWLMMQGLLMTLAPMTKMLTLSKSREWSLSSLSAGPQRRRGMSMLAHESSPEEVLRAGSKKSGLGLRRGVWQLGLGLAVVQPSTLDRLLTSTHCDRCVRDGGRIAGRASGGSAVVDCVSEVGNAAQAVEVHSRTVERARIVQGRGVTLFLSGRQSCPAPQGGRQPVKDLHRTGPDCPWTGRWRAPPARPGPRIEVPT